jgi:predicted kinase
MSAALSSAATAVLISLSGLPGVAKTTLARELAAQIGAVHLRIDSIEQALRNEGIQVEGEGYAVAYAVAEDNLRLGRIVISDCVNPDRGTREAWRAVADRAGVRMVDVEIVCSDSDEHRRRAESRVADITAHRLPTWNDVQGRDYVAWDGQPIVIDTAARPVGSVRSCFVVGSQHWTRESSVVATCEPPCNAFPLRPSRSGADSL